MAVKLDTVEIIYLYFMRRAQTSFTLFVTIKYRRRLFYKYKDHNQQFDQHKVSDICDSVTGYTHLSIAKRIFLPEHFPFAISFSTSS